MACSAAIGSCSFVVREVLGEGLQRWCAGTQAVLPNAVITT